MQPQCAPQEQVTIWRPDVSGIEEYGGNPGGDDQVTNYFSIRLINDRNHSTIDVNVYGVGLCWDEDAYTEYGVDVQIDFESWRDAEHTVEGDFADIQYEPGSVYSIDSPEAAFEEARRVAESYLKTATRDFYWDGESSLLR